LRSTREEQQQQQQQQHFSDFIFENVITNEAYARVGYGELLLLSVCRLRVAIADRMI